VEILVGGAAVNTISLRTEPTAVPVTGGPAEVIPTAVDVSGNPVVGAPVVFSANSGTLNPQQVATDANGQARTTLTTTRETLLSHKIDSCHPKHCQCIGFNLARANQNAPLFRIIVLEDDCRRKRYCAWRLAAPTKGPILASGRASRGADTMQPT
jgi:hypothetical protein